MRYQLKISRRAAGQIRDAADWWADNREKAPDALAEDIEGAFQLLTTLPGVGERVRHHRLVGLRRLLVSRIRYHLYYVLHEEDSAVEVLALWHASRGSAPSL